MSKYRIKFPSFGLLEAIIASMVIVLLLSGAVTLASTSLHSATTNSNFHEAEHIADILAEKVVAAKSAGKITFSGQLSDDSLIPIACFNASDATLDNNAKCRKGNDITKPFKDELPFPVPHPGTRYDDDNFVKVLKSDDRVPFDDTIFANGYFKWKMVLENGPGGAIGERCPSVTGVQIPDSKCRVVRITVKWGEFTSKEQFVLRQYITDWEK